MKFFRFIFSAILLSSVMFMTSCGGDDNNNNDDGYVLNDYKLVVTFTGSQAGKYLKQVGVRALNYSGNTIDVDIKDGNGKVINSNLSDQNYIFSTTNTFTPVAKAHALVVVVDASYIGSEDKTITPLTVNVKVYRNGELFKEDTGTITASGTISYTFSKTL